MKLKVRTRYTGWLGFTLTVQSEFRQNNNILLLQHWPRGLQNGLDPPYSLHLLVCIRFLQPLKSRCRKLSLPMPSDLHMFRFMIAFPLCFRMGKAHIGGRHAPNVRPDAVSDVLKMQGWTHLLYFLRMAPILEFYPTLLCSLFVMTSFTCCIPQSCLLVLNCLHTFFALHSSAWNHPTC